MVTKQIIKQTLEDKFERCHFIDEMDKQSYTFEVQNTDVIYSLTYWDKGYLEVVKVDKLNDDHITTSSFENVTADNIKHFLSKIFEWKG